MPFFRRGPQPPTQAISTKLKLEPITVKKKKASSFSCSLIYPIGYHRFALFKIYGL